MVIEFDQEADGRWIADIPAMPGVMAYGKTRAEAALAVKVLALRVIASEMEQGRKNSGCRKLEISIACGM
jgi:predicted RNase H-like HicB family nuclease